MRTGCNPNKNCLPDALKPADIRKIIAVAQAAEPRLEVLVTGVLAKMGA